MTVGEVRKRYLEFYARPPRRHAVIPSVSLVPENDPTTLFTGSGMQPLLPYLMGEKHPKGTRLANSQKCFRAEDIEEVGDNRHTTFFEMLGNWSLGDYFKEEQLAWFFEFLTSEIGLSPEQLYVTVFAGDKNANVPQDKESAAIWENLFKGKGIVAKDAMMGSEESGYKRGMKKNERIFYYDSEKNWWSRAGTPKNMPVGELGGPDSEVFFDFDPTGKMHDTRYGEHCHPNCECGRFVEIGNSVFMEYIKKEDGDFTTLPQKNVDFGGGLERITAAAGGNPDVFKVDSLYSVIKQLETLSGKRYGDNLTAFRIITDHIRGAVFMIGDGVFPSNTERGYFVRRLLRRSIRYADVLEVPEGELKNLAASVVEAYRDYYTELTEREGDIVNVIAKEEEKFRTTLVKGLKEFEKRAGRGEITGEDAFVLFTTYGFPYELTKELAGEKCLILNEDEFDTAMEKHREISRAGVEQKFKGGLADSSDKVVAYHTVTHLLLAGLRRELGADVHQAGSNITSERLRFDFTYPEKVNKDTLGKVEDFVNNAIQAHASVTVETVSKNRARSDPTVEGSFWDKYPDEITVYTIKGGDGVIYSRELCGGPHVENTGKIKETFRIIKEEAISAGVRRVRATLE